LLYLVIPVPRSVFPFTKFLITALKPGQLGHNFHVSTYVPLVVFVNMFFFFQQTQNVGVLSSSLISKILKTAIHRTIILPVVYECKTWSLTLREERRLRVLRIGC
jgi:hypothetical protein